MKWSWCMTQLPKFSKRVCVLENIEIFYYFFFNVQVFFFRCKIFIATELGKICKISNFYKKCFTFYPSILDARPVILYFLSFQFNSLVHFTYNQKADLRKHKKTIYTLTNVRKCYTMQNKTKLKKKRTFLPNV